VTRPLSALGPVLAGTLCRAGTADASAVRRALGTDPSGETVSGVFAAAWTGSRASPGAWTVVLVGSIRNLPALAAELGREAADTEHVLALAFERWGEGTLPRLRGSFALAAWNEAAKRGLLAVDQLGAGPLFVHESYGRLTFATEIRNLVRLLPSHPGPDAEGVVLWVTAGCLRRGRTLLEGVRRLEGGQFVRLSDSGWQLARYWSPG
jgi:asparagine synthase (glutamine-hydrolysing)